MRMEPLNQTLYFGIGRPAQPLFDVSVPKDFGINRAEREKVTKYQDLKNALKDEWELKEIAVIPVIVGATGITKDNLQNYLDNIPGKPDKY